MPPPPPPFHESGSWDFFDPIDENGSFSFAASNEVDFSFDGVEKKKKTTCEPSGKDGSFGNGEVKKLEEVGLKKEDKSLVEKDMSGEREDPSEFITHRAKDFLSSIKDIEHRFFRASESGKEVSRMLEANKIRVGYSEAKGS